MSTKTIDILLPTANPDGGLIRRAIQSIVDQEFTQWRLLIGSDGNAHAAAAVQEFNDPRISYFDFPKRGKPATLNALALECSGDYIAYLDDDDFWYPSHLNVAISYLQQHAARFVHTDAFSVHVVKTDTGYRETGRFLLNRGALSNLLLYSISHINVVHERSLLNEAGAYDLSRRYFIDWDMYIRMAQLATPHHVPVVTCEHIFYYDAQDRLLNPISRAHQEDPVLSREMQRANFLRARAFLDDERYLQLIEDLDEKSYNALALESRLSVQTQALAAQEQQSVMQQQALTEQAEKLVAQEKALEVQEKALAEQAQNFARQQEVLAEKEQQIALQEKELAANQQALAAYEKLCADQKQSFNELQKEFWISQSALADTRQAFADLMQRIAGMEQTLSWRITRPLRAARRFQIKLLRRKSAR